MTFKLISSGPFYGLPAIHVAPREIGGPSSIAETTAKMGEAEKTFGLGPGKKFLVINNVEDGKFDELVPFIRLARENGYFIIGNGSSQVLSAVAPELNAYVAHHFAGCGDEWLNYRCSGFVLHNFNVSPKFNQNTQGIPKFLSGRGDANLGMRYSGSSMFAWAYQELLISTEVTL